MTCPPPTEVEAASGFCYGEGWHLDSRPIWSAEDDAILYLDAEIYPKPIVGVLRLFVYAPQHLAAPWLLVDSVGHPPRKLPIPASGLLEVRLKTPLPVSYSGARPKPLLQTALVSQYGAAADSAAAALLPPVRLKTMLQITLSLTQINSPAEVAGSLDTRRLGLQVLGFAPLRHRDRLRHLLRPAKTLLRTILRRPAS